MTETKTTWGGKRDGAGRPPKTPERCTCGRHTNARALRLRLKCRIVPGYTSKGARLLQSVTAGLPAIAGIEITSTRAARHQRGEGHVRAA